LGSAAPAALDFGGFMKIREGMLVTIRDSAGNQVFGLDSAFARSLVERHGANGAYLLSIGHGMTVEVVAYTDHRSRFSIWKHKFLEWMYRRQLQKALDLASRSQSVTPMPIRPPAMEEESLSRATLWSADKIKSPSTFSSTSLQAGLPDGGTSQGESYER
jgi:hypothetical protein